MKRRLNCLLFFISINIFAFSSILFEEGISMITKECKIFIYGLSDLALYISKILSQDYQVSLLVDKNINSFAYVFEESFLVKKINYHDTAWVNELSKEKPFVFMAFSEHDQNNIFLAQLIKNVTEQLTIAFLKSDNQLIEYFDIDLILSWDKIFSRLINIYLSVSFQAKKIIYINKNNYLGIFEGRKLRQEINFSNKLLLIERNNNLFSPENNDIVYPDDRVYINFNFPMKPSKEKVFLLGSNEEVFRLAEKLKLKHQLRIITGKKILKEVVEKYSSDFFIIQGSGTEKDVLQEAGLSKDSIFIILTKDDFENIITAIMAKKLGIKRLQILINDYKSLDLLRQLNIDNYIYFSEAILYHIHLWLTGSKLAQENHQLTQNEFISTIGKVKEMIKC